MGCHKLTYHNSQEALEVNPFFYQRGLRKNSSAEKNRLTTYTYGFNGMERDDNTYGSGNAYDFGARIYDCRLGRFMSTDPLGHHYPHMSTYSFAANCPIRLIDVYGLAPGDPLTNMEIRKNRASNLQGYVRNGGSRPHQGFDLIAPPGTPTMAVANATVYAVRTTQSYGLQVILEIDNEDGTKSYAFYAHLSSTTVKKGDKVTEGQVIGKTGTSGNASNDPNDAHLHFEYRSQPLPGKGLGGRLNPNDILDTKFYSQNPEANQTYTGVYRVNPDGTADQMNLDGSVESVGEFSTSEMTYSVPTSSSAEPSEDPGAPAPTMGALPGIVIGSNGQLDKNGKPVN